MTRYLVGVVCALALGVMGCSESSETSDGAVFACTEQGIRDAIAKGGGPHTFECDGPITVVTEAAIEIDNNVVLNGEGNLTVDAFSQHRVFLVAQHTTAELREITVSRGIAWFGGGIFNDGTLALTNSAVSGSSAGRSGGGIFNGGTGTLTLTNSTVSDNSGGGIDNNGSLTLTDSTVSDNSGGGIDSSGSLTLTDSTVAGNNSPSEGGGINAGIGGSSTLVRSTVSGNSADSGGGIHKQSGTMTLTDSTVSGNTANRSKAAASSTEAR